MIATVNNFTKKDLKEIFDSYYESLVLYANRFLLLRDACEDLVQDIFVDFWEKDLSFPDEISLKVYLYKSARNKCYNVIKHNKVKNLYGVNHLRQIEDDEVFLKHILEEEIVRKLYHLIDALPKRKKEIIKLSLKGLKNKEIAENLNIQLQTVKTLKSQSYTILREEFKEISAIVYFLIT